MDGDCGHSQERGRRSLSAQFPEFTVGKKHALVMFDMEEIGAEPCGAHGPAGGSCQLGVGRFLKGSITIWRL